MQIIQDTDGTIASFEREELHELRRRLIMGGLDNAHEWITLLNATVTGMPAKDMHADRTRMPVLVDPAWEKYGEEATAADEDTDEGVIR